jgi:hypothetical protein
LSQKPANSNAPKIHSKVPRNQLAPRMPNTGYNHEISATEGQSNMAALAERGYDLVVLSVNRRPFSAIPPLAARIGAQRQPRLMELLAYPISKVSPSTVFRPRFRAPFERVSTTVGLLFPGNGILRDRDAGVEKARHI